MNLKKTKIILCCAISVFFIFACKAAEGLLDQAAKQAGVDSSLANQVKKGAKEGYATVEKVMDALSDMSLEDERVLGETVGVQLYSTDGFGEPVNNPDLMKFMNTMTAVIAENSERPEIPYHVAVVRSDEKNAYALPGGYIFVTTGLIMSLQNEAQLAVVLGHEIAHIAKKHTLNKMANDKTLGALVGAAGSLSKSALEGMDIDGPGFDAFVNFIGELGNEIKAHSFSKESELEADAEGLRYAYDTGYDPSAILGVLDILQANDTNVEGDHATTSDRRASYEEVVAGFEDTDGLVMTTGRLAQVKQWIQNDQGW